MKHMLGRLVLLSGACASAAAENVVDLTKSIKKKNRLGSSRRVHHGLNEEEDDLQADGYSSSFTVLQRMKREGVHQEDVPRHIAPVASHDVGVLSSKGDEEEVQLVKEREEDEVAPVTNRIIERLTAGHVRAADNAISSSSGVQGGSATATKTNQNNDFGALDNNAYQGEYGGEGEDEDKERVYYDEKRVLVHQEEAYDPAAYDVTAAAASYESRQLAVNASMSGSCPPGDVVTCVGGFATSVGNVTYDEGTKTCQDACAAGGECCVGDGTGIIGGPFDGQPINSCTGFNGKVCKSGDIPSCSDNRTTGDKLGKACYYANIAEVVNGCNGYRACEWAGIDGDLGRVVNACHGGDKSCYYAAALGYIKEIVDSCIGKEACRAAAYDGGYIGSITNGSCIGGEKSCFLTAAYGGGNISSITNGCRGVGACQFAASKRSIDGISYACNNISACENLANGQFGFDNVNSAVVSCCNEASECTGSIVQASGGLPDQCPTPSPTLSPTTEVRILYHALYNMLYIQFINL